MSGYVVRCPVVVAGLLLVVGCGDPPLVSSIKRGDAKISKDLLAKGVDLDAQDRTGATALHAAIAAGNRQVYQELLSRGANPNVCDEKGLSVVHLAARQDDVFWLQEVLKHGGNPDQPSMGNRHTSNSTPIFYAIEEGKSDNVLELIAAGADLNHLSDFHNTRPLWSAMGARMWDTVIRMIEGGADPRLPNPNNGKTILDCCGWFDEGYEKFAFNEADKQAYLRLKEFMVEKGYLERK